MKTISIITVCYNAEQEIERTLQSVIGQQGFEQQIEYIVIDGHSSDGTLTKIEPYQQHIAQIVSEPDRGIFDAMNKGARLATSPWILFMNAGDTFMDATTLASLQLPVQTPDHIIYGDSTRVYADGRQELRKADPFFNKRGCVPGIGICHQSIILPRLWMTEHPYQWQLYPHCADFEQMLSFYNEGRRFQYVDRSLCLYSYGEGFSSSKQNIRKVLNENAAITGLKGSWTYYKQLIRLWLSSLK